MKTDGQAAAKVMSTSRLAKQLGVDAKQVFQLLQQHGWIERVDDNWQLTAKGEFHGGSYQQSDKYGQYIVWPEEVVNQPLLMEFDQALVSATRLAQQYGLDGALLNLLFADLGWITRDQRGWMLTDAGRALGAETRSSKQGIYALWPAAVKKHSAFVAGIANLQGEALPHCLDGHPVKTAGEQRIDNWLYLHQITHACHRALPGSQDLHASFYLPMRQVYIDYWDSQDKSQSLSARLDKQALTQKHQLKLIELTDQDLDDLDQILSQKLLQFGIQKY